MGSVSFSKNRRLSNIFSSFSGRLIPFAMTGSSVWIPISSCSDPAGNCLIFSLNTSGKVVGDHLEMGKIGGLFGEEKIEDSVGEGHIEIERSVDEFETSSAALPNLKLFEELIEWESYALFHRWRRGRTHTRTDSRVRLRRRCIGALRLRR
jgi:hypothetical protein